MGLGFGDACGAGLAGHIVGRGWGKQAIRDLNRARLLAENGLLVSALLLARAPPPGLRLLLNRLHELQVPRQSVGFTALCPPARARMLPGPEGGPMWPLCARTSTLTSLGQQVARCHRPGCKPMDAPGVWFVALVCQKNLASIQHAALLLGLLLSLRATPWILMIWTCRPLKPFRQPGLPPCATSPPKHATSGTSFSLVPWLLSRIAMMRKPGASYSCCRKVYSARQRDGGRSTREPSLLSC